jgi:hypothetical protein
MATGWKRVHPCCIAARFSGRSCASTRRSIVWLVLALTTGDGVNINSLGRFPVCLELPVQPDSSSKSVLYGPCIQGTLLLVLTGAQAVAQDNVGKARVFIIGSESWEMIGIHRRMSRFQSQASGRAKLGCCMHGYAFSPRCPAFKSHRRSKACSRASSRATSDGTSAQRNERNRNHQLAEEMGALVNKKPVPLMRFYLHLDITTVQILPSVDTRTGENVVFRQHLTESSG